ncbi:MAG: hypothetical protein KC431_10875, partial [Myxococcales bacterium]|nr:hypothetical protein [Myxococcales bacterium]
GPLFDRLAHSLTGEAWRAAVDAVLEEGGLREFTVEVPQERGSSRWYEVRLAAVEFDGPRRAIAIVTDISGRRRAEAEARQLEVQIRQQQRLESIGTLAAGVAHEINNPIQGIMNYAEILGTHGSEPEIVSEFAGEIAHEAERVATIVRDLLAFSRHEGTLPRAEIGIGVLVDGTLSLIRSILIRDGIELQVELPATLPPVLCQPQQVQQIIMNLVTNARDALREHGVAEPRVRIGAEATAGMLRVLVEDNGPGVPAEVLPYIFDPFFTT